MLSTHHPKFHYNWHMKKMISLIMTALLSIPSFACSVFMQPQTGMVAKNYDWSLVAGELMIRPRLAKKNRCILIKAGSVCMVQSLLITMDLIYLPEESMNTD